MSANWQAKLFLHGHLQVVSISENLNHATSEPGRLSGSRCAGSRRAWVRDSRCAATKAFSSTHADLPPLSSSLSSPTCVLNKPPCQNRVTQEKNNVFVPSTPWACDLDKGSCDKREHDSEPGVKHYVSKGMCERECKKALPDPAAPCPPDKPAFESCQGKSCGQAIGCTIGYTCQCYDESGRYCTAMVKRRGAQMRDGCGVGQSRCTPEHTIDDPATLVRRRLRGPVGKPPPPPTTRTILKPHRHQPTHV